MQSRLRFYEQQQQQQQQQQDQSTQKLASFAGCPGNLISKRQVDPDGVGAVELSTFNAAMLQARWALLDRKICQM